MSATLRSRPRSAAAAPDAAPLPERLRSAIHRLSRMLRQQDEGGYGQTAVAALATISKQGPITLGELAAHERVAPPSITKVVERLVGEGFVHKDVDVNDRRVTRVSITRQGQRQLDRIRQVRTEWLASRLDALTADELERLTGALDVLEKLVAIPDGPAR